MQRKKTFGRNKPNSGLSALRAGSVRFDENENRPIDLRSNEALDKKRKAGRSCGLTNLSKMIAFSGNFLL